MTTAAVQQQLSSVVSLTEADRVEVIDTAGADVRRRKYELNYETHELNSDHTNSTAEQ